MTIDNIFSFQILLLLFPGFITTAIITNLIPSDRKRGIDKIIESFAYSLFIYTLYVLISKRFSISLIDITSTSVFTINPLSLIVLLGISVLVGIILVMIIKWGILFNILNKLKITRSTGKLNTWIQLFDEFAGEKYFAFYFKDGKKLLGHPKYYNILSDKKEFFLEDAAWVTNDGTSTDIAGEGILITEYNKIEYIEIFSPEKK